MSQREVGFLQFGAAPGPFQTVKVVVKHEYADNWLAFYEGKWRKVNIQVRRTYIVVNGERITIKIQGV